MSLPLDYPFITVGDSEPVAEAWRIEGFADENTDHGRLHVTAAIVGGLLRFSVYKDRAKTLLVLQGEAAAGARATLTAQNNSGLSGSVKVNAVEATNLVLFLALATDRDIEQRDDRIAGLRGEEPDEVDFQAVWSQVMRRFYLGIQADFPPPQFASSPLHFPGASPTQIQGKRGQPDVHAILLWHLNGEGDWELKGLQNPGDWRDWAILYSLFLIWDRKARSGDDGLVTRADRYLIDADRAWKMVPILLDSDGDQAPEREIRTKSVYINRG